MRHGWRDCWLAVIRYKKRYEDYYSNSDCKRGDGRAFERSSDWHHWVFLDKRISFSGSLLGQARLRGAERLQRTRRLQVGRQWVQRKELLQRQGRMRGYLTGGWQEMLRVRGWRF